tara:strand:+ start:199 stop:654 length:456 start_codon:yes stop_codon:yes gene_type:complete
MAKRGKYLQGRFNPRNPEKYNGNVKNIIYRSSWELKALQWCDRNENVLEYGSEEIFIPYFDENTRKIRRYFPDLFLKIRDKNGIIKKYLIEIKPKSQTKLPEKTSGKKQKTYINEMITYQNNQSKWKYARQWCEDNGIIFMILTEDELKVM